MGRHSGLLPLLPAMWSHLGNNNLLVLEKPAWKTLKHFMISLNRFLNKDIGWKYYYDSGIPFYDEENFLIEKAAIHYAKKNSFSWIFLESVEDQLCLLSAEKTKIRNAKLAGISHQPPTWWRLYHGRHDLMEKIDALFVFSKESADFWQNQIPKEKIHFIFHGVDLDFFSPDFQKAESTSRKIRRILFCGQWMRDFETLANVIDAIFKNNIAVEFDLVVPWFARQQDACYRIARHQNVHWHADICDDALLQLYRDCDLVLLPLLDCTANNTILEAMACGKALIVSDVGAIRDYVSEDFAELTPLGDYNAIVESLVDHCRSTEKLLIRGKAARRHAEMKFNWKTIAKEITEILR